jgi:predicted metalloprotease
MRWQGRAGSGNIEDRRGMGVGLPVGGGIGGLVLLLLFSALTGQNPLDMINSGGSTTPGQNETVGTTGTGADDPQKEFVSVVLADTEETWRQIFRERGEAYAPPILVLFENATQSACGMGSAAMGPFYCPADRKVYLDLSFFRDLEQRFGAPGDFAQAYVIAHEVGHHIQTVTGLSERLAQARGRASEAQSNTLSVRQELQADCFAGVWGHYAARKDLLHPGDAEEGLRAAAAIGDDRLQQQSQGRVVPESFTHGSSEQRVEWLRRGMEAGNMDACNTFSQETR